MKNITRKSYLLIADISGYTQFMLNGKMELEHSQEIITNLMESIIEEIRIPIRISKFEGDAIFFFVTSEAEGSWFSKIFNFKSEDETFKQNEAILAQKLPAFIHAFRTRLGTLIKNGKCSCGACHNISALKLKIFVHLGNVHFYEIRGHKELSGLDVIILHRLLKNDITAKEYILITENASPLLEYDALKRLPFEQSPQSYEDVGQIPAYVALVADNEFVMDSRIG